MNLAQMLAERMKSPGAMGEFKDKTSNPDALKHVEAGNDTQMPGSGKQEPYPMATDGVDGDDDDPQTGGGLPGDAGLGMLTNVAHGATGKHKATLDKAIAHGKAKHGAHMKAGHHHPMHGKK